MRISNLWKSAGTASLALALLGTAAPATAQIQPVVFGSAEADTQDQSIFLLGASVQPARLGLNPFAGLMAYRLTYPMGAGTGTVNAFAPSVGLRYQTPTSAVQGSIGYLFLSEDVPGGFGAAGGTRQGLTTGALAEYWGTTGAMNAQGIVSYNVADEYIWARGRGAVGVLPMAGGWLRVGGEVVGQGGGSTPAGQPAGERYSAFQIGPLVDLQATRTLRLIGVVGLKTDNLDFPDRPGQFPYFKGEFVWVP
jgi:hypothetical protein